MSSDPFLDPQHPPMDPVSEHQHLPATPYQHLPATNPERVLALLESPESPITSALTAFAADGRGGGLLAGLGGVLPLVLKQGADQLRGIPGDQVDATLLDLARMLLGARSPVAEPHAVLLLGPMVDLPVGAGEAGPSHNED